MAMSPPTVLLIGTCDTKLSELLYVQSHIDRYGAVAKLMDVGSKAISHPEIDYPHSEVLSHVSYKPQLDSLERGEIIKSMTSGAISLTLRLYTQSSIHGMICIGGSSGTSLGATVMRSTLPVGFPKMIVSTVASGDVSNFVGESDIAMVSSVVDIAGKNSILNPILENAAGMIVGASKAYRERRLREKEASADNPVQKKKSVAITMFGVTTPAADAARLVLEQNGYEVFVFHVTGVGGKAMEALISQRRIDAVLDLTTSELADELVGGIMSAGPDRLTAASKMGLPQVVSLGALDLVNFGPRQTVSEKFADRLLHEHNPDVTVLRTSAEECATLGKRIAERLTTHAKSPELVRVFIPVGGISILSMKGGPFFDKDADEALFDAVEDRLHEAGIGVIGDERAINDDGFSSKMAECLMDLMRREELMQ